MSAFETCPVCAQSTTLGTTAAYETLKGGSYFGQQQQQQPLQQSMLQQGIPQQQQQQILPQQQQQAIPQQQQLVQQQQPGIQQQQQQQQLPNYLNERVDWFAKVSLKPASRFGGSTAWTGGLTFVSTLNDSQTGKNYDEEMIEGFKKPTIGIKTSAVKSTLPHTGRAFVEIWRRKAGKRNKVLHFSSPRFVNRTYEANSIATFRLTNEDVSDPAYYAPEEILLKVRVGDQGRLAAENSILLIQNVL